MFTYYASRTFLQFCSLTSHSYQFFWGVLQSKPVFFLVSKNHNFLGPKLLSVERICSHHAFLCHMQHWSSFWQTSEDAHSIKAWWPCAHLWELWSDMQRRDEAEDTHGFAQENYLQTLWDVVFLQCAFFVSSQSTKISTCITANVACEL